MSYLNTSMTKRAGKKTILAALLGVPSAIGATIGGIAGHSNSEKPNNTPATTLGAIGGGTGALAGILTTGRAFAKPIGDKVERIYNKLDGVNHLDIYMDAVSKGYQKLPPRLSMDILKTQKASLEKQLARTPKWLKSLAKSNKRYNALMLGVTGLGAAAGGTLGTTLGVKGGDALA